MFFPEWVWKERLGHHVSNCLFIHLTNFLSSCCEPSTSQAAGATEMSKTWALPSRSSQPGEDPDKAKENSNVIWQVWWNEKDTCTTLSRLEGSPTWVAGGAVAWDGSAEQIPSILLVLEMNTWRRPRMSFREKFWLQPEISSRSLCNSRHTNEMPSGPLRPRF